MLKRLLIGILCIFQAQQILAQAYQNFNLTRLGRLPYNEELANIWGYTSPAGAEYALVGVHNGVSIVNIDNPQNLVQNAYVNLTPSIWRELRTYQNYAYVVGDATRDGVTIINLANLPNSVTHQTYKPVLTTQSGQQDSLLRAHTIHIDGHYMYLSGSNLQGGAVLIFDLQPNPTAPVYVGCVPNLIYAHDCYVRNGRLYTADLYVGTFSVYDISNPASPVFLASHPTPNSFTHHLWLSDDSRTIFTTDERADAYVAAFDISNLNNIQETDRYRTWGEQITGTIPHNVHVKNDFIVTSYYTDGLVIIDGSRPQNLIEVARYDTYQNGRVGFYGDWGVFPYFNSGKVIASDINTGLHVFQPQYRRACWLEGLVTEAGTNNPIQDATIRILNNTLPVHTNSNLVGDYKTGIGQAGVYNVQYLKAGYIPQTLLLNLQHGQVNTQNVTLTPDVAFTLNGNVSDIDNNAAIPNAKIRLQSTNGVYDWDIQADASGNFSLNGFYAGEYKISTGKWGYKSIQNVLQIGNNSPQPIRFYLEKGYKDEFVLDLGWSVNTISSGGAWARTIPYQPAISNPQGDLIIPMKDVSGDIDEYCYITGIFENGNPDHDDVDNGITSLVSPLIDATDFNDPYLTYYYWFANEMNAFGVTDDTLSVIVRNGTDTKIVAKYANNPNRTWSNLQQIRLSEHLAISNQMTVEFKAGDVGVNQNIVKAGIDLFEIRDGQTLTNVAQLSENLPPLIAFPNPSKNGFMLSFQNPLPQAQDLQVYDALGRFIQQIAFPADSENIQIGADWQAGVYILQAGTQRLKLIKQ